MRRSEHRYTRLGAALASAWFFASGAASAQHADAQRAATGQALFDKAVEEMKRGDLDSACPKLEEVTRLVPDGIGAKIELARCYERWGRTASAWAQWTRVEALARRKGQGDRQTEAAARAEALRPRVARLTVEVAPGTARIPKLASTSPTRKNGRTSSMRSREQPGRHSSRSARFDAPTSPTPAPVSTSPAPTLPSARVSVEIRPSGVFRPPPAQTASELAKSTSMSRRSPGAKLIRCVFVSRLTGSVTFTS